VKLKLDIDPDIVAMMAAEVAAGERAVTAAMREAGTGLKTAWRLQITGAGLGPRLANSIRSQNFPRSGESLDAAALVWSKAPVIVGAHDTGPLIRSKDGFWLAIPLPAAGKVPARWQDHARRMGMATRAAPALRLSPHGSESSGGGGAFEHEGPGGRVPLEDRARKGDRPDLPAGAASEAAEAAGPRARCGPGAGQCAGA
jgi:hypothetical protein